MEAIKDMQNKWNVKPRNNHAEWVLLNRYFGTETMGIWFNDFSGYDSAREKSTYQQIFEVVKQSN